MLCCCFPDAEHTLVAASLLHDLGHLLIERSDAEFGPDMDDIHQYLAIPFPRRYLCRADPGTGTRFLPRRSAVWNCKAAFMGPRKPGALSPSPSPKPPRDCVGRSRQDPRQGHAVAH